MAASCNDDDESCGRGLFFDDSLFEGRADAPTPRFMTRQKRLNTRKRRDGIVAEEQCKNCNATCLKLVFNCACTVECALGYFLKRKQVDNFLVVSANFRIIPPYRDLLQQPQAAFPDSLSKDFLDDLYPSKDDLRRSAYLRQIKDNYVSHENHGRGVLQRTA